MSGKQRNIRKRRALDEQEELSEGEPEAVAEGQPPRLTAEDVKLLQKQRQRRTGVEASTLMAAALRADRKAAAAAAGPVEHQQDVLQAAFKRERRLQSEEEDPHMKQYIEEQLAKRLGRPVDEAEEAAAAAAAAARARADPHLAAMPEELKKREQDTELEPSWVTGILEVPLSMEQKLANIEAVEAAKNRLLAAADPEEVGAGQPGAVRRGQYPVGFGRQDPKMLKVIAEAQAKKARMRVFQEEKKRKKKEEFAGW